MTDELLPAVCPLGKMQLSQVAHQALRDYVDKPQVPASPASGMRWGGVWHCPADGTRMQESEGRVRCPACSRQLPGWILYQLIELHSRQDTRKAPQQDD
jgi:hypothetical protein